MLLFDVSHLELVFKSRYCGQSRRNYLLMTVFRKLLHARTILYNIHQLPIGIHSVIIPVATQKKLVES